MTEDTPLREPPEMLAALRDLVADTLRRTVGLEPEIAAHVGHEVMYAFAQHWGGDAVYIPKADTLQRYERDLRIWADFNGHNHAELARKYRISKVWVYAIVKRMRAADAERRQCRLFLPEPTPQPAEQT